MQWPDHFVWLTLWEGLPELWPKAMLERNLAQAFWTFKISSGIIALSSAMNPQDRLVNSIKLEQPLEWTVGRLRSYEEWTHNLQGVPLVSNGPCGEHGRDLVGKWLAVWTCERPFNGVIRWKLRRCPRGRDLTNPSQQVHCPTGTRFCGMGV